MEKFLNKIINNDCLLGLKLLPDYSVDCCVTSPPYFNLRNYDVEGQIGNKKTPEEYVDKMVLLFTEVKRILKKEGTLWLNLGDTFFGGCGGPQSWERKSKNIEWHEESKRNPHRKDKSKIYKSKDLIGIPWMVAFALRNSGWYLRSDIIWNKPNPMPESVQDRPTRSHEYIFLLSKSSEYYYDIEAIKEDSVDAESYEGRRERNAPKMSKFDLNNLKNSGSILENGKLKSGMVYEKRNKRSVWTVTTKPYKESHFATFPEDLIVDCIKAGCPENGIVLDPFFGAGTTGLVAKKFNRNYIGFELNPEYIKIAENRIFNEIGLFNNQ